MTEQSDHQITVAVQGMKCGGCESNIKNELTSHDGILSVEASHEDDSVKVVFDETKMTINKIKEIIVEAGFSVES